MTASIAPTPFGNVRFTSHLLHHHTINLRSCWHGQWPLPAAPALDTRLGPKQGFNPVKKEETDHGR